MQREYYRLKIIYKKEIFCIWVTSESGDKFLICNDKVLAFTDEKTLNLYCKEQQIPLAEKECTIQRIPAWAEVKRMLYVPHFSKKDCRQIEQILHEIYAVFERRLLYPAGQNDGNPFEGK